MTEFWEEVLFQGRWFYWLGTRNSKSTILTEIAKNLPSTVLYVCGEESASQVKIRTSRMGYTAENLLVLSETNAESIVGSIENSKDLGLVIIDSIQTLFSDELIGNQGSLVQVRGCSQILTSVAKRLVYPLFL